MSGSLGTLVVEIAASMARFEADMGKAQKVANDTMSKMQKDVSQAMGAIESSLAAVSKAFGVVTAVAAGGAAFNAVISSTRAWTGEVVKLSKAMGSNLADASAYNVALRLTGQDADVALQATAKLTKTLSTNQAAFAAHGIAIKDSSGHLLGQQQIISNTFESLSKLKSGTDRNTAANELLGKSFFQLSGLAKINNEVLAESKELAESLGLTVDGKTAEAVKKYGYEMNKLKLVHEAFKVNVGETVLPALVKIEASFNNIAIAAAKMKSKGGMAETFTVNAAGLILMEQRLNSKEFLLHPIDTVTKLTADLHALKVAADKVAAKNTPSAPNAGGENNPTSAADRKAAEAAQKAAEEAARQHYNQGVSAYNGFIDDLARGDFTLDAHAKKIAEIQRKVDEAAKEYPEFAKDIREVGKDLIDQAKAAKALADEISNLTYENKLWHESLVGSAPEVYGRGLEPIAGFMSYGLDKKGKKKPVASLMGNDDFGKPKYDLLGTVGKNPAVTEKQTEMDQLKEIQKRGEQEILSMKMGAASQGIALMQQVAGESKGMAIAALVAQKSLAVAQILLNSNVAASAALLPPPVGLGPVEGQVLAAEIRGMGYLSAGLAAATGVAELGNTLSGRRALGGPVRSGETYLVGENGPELMTVGASGFVTPNDRIGGGSVTIPQYFNFAAGTSDEVRQQMRMMGKQAKEEAKAEILASMQRGGTFAKASGRMR